MLFAPWAKCKGDFSSMKFDLMGCIGTTKKLENQCRNSHRAVYVPAISLKVQPSIEILSHFVTFTGITKIPLTSSKMDGLSISKILLLAKT